MDLLFLVGRILFGGFFLMNGINHIMKADMLAQYAQSKGVASPKFSVVFSGLLILLGGLGIILGAYVIWSVLFIAVFLLGVSFKMHDFWKVQDSQMKMGEMVNFTKNMALLGAALVMLAIPTPWAFGLF